MPDTKPPEVEIVNDPETEPEEGSEVVIDLEKKPEEKQADLPKPAVVQTPDEVRRLHNTIAYQTRKLEQAMRELQEMRTTLASRPQTVQESSRDLDEIDEIAQKDWKLGVKKVVEKDIEAKVQELLQRQAIMQAQVQRQASLESELDKSKQKVLSKYPYVEDDSTEESSDRKST